MCFDKKKHLVFDLVKLSVRRYSYNIYDRSLQCQVFHQTEEFTLSGISVTGLQLQESG